jgi:hypothetical protein
MLTQLALLLALLAGSLFLSPAGTSKQNPKSATSLESLRPPVCPKDCPHGTVLDPITCTCSPFPL